MGREEPKDWMQMELLEMMYVRLVVLDAEVDVEEKHEAFSDFYVDSRFSVMQ